MYDTDETPAGSPRHVSCPAQQSRAHDATEGLNTYVSATSPPIVLGSVPTRFLCCSLTPLTRGGETTILQVMPAQPFVEHGSLDVHDTCSQRAKTRQQQNKIKNSIQYRRAKHSATHRPLGTPVTAVDVIQDVDVALVSGCRVRRQRDDRHGHDGTGGQVSSCRRTR